MTMSMKIISSDFQMDGLFYFVMILGLSPRRFVFLELRPIMYSLEMAAQNEAINFMEIKKNLLLLFEKKILFPTLQWFYQSTFHSICSVQHSNPTLKPQSKTKCNLPCSWIIIIRMMKFTSNAKSK